MSEPLPKTEPLSKIVTIGGKDYSFELTTSAHRRVKAATNISLPDCVADIAGVRNQEERGKALDGFRALMNDFDNLPKIAYAMLEPQLKSNGVSQEQFDDLFDGPVLFNTGRAITRALIDFFHDDPRGKLLAGAVEMAAKAARVHTEMDKQVTEAMDRKMETMRKKMSGQEGADAIDKTIQEILTNSSMTLPESLRSILAPSP